MNLSRLPPLPPRPARGADTARFFGALGLGVSLVALAARRVDAIGTETMFASLALALALALVGFALVLVTLSDVWRYGRKGARRSFGTLIFILFAFSPVIGAGVALAFFPPIDEVSTDTDDPPPLPAQARRLALPVALLAPADRFAELQGQAYPDIAPLSVDLSTVEAFALARTSARELGWTITLADEPGTEAAAGRIEAEGKSLLLAVPEDLVVRLTPTADGCRLDLRSASRYPIPDLGDNARNIRAFFAKFQEVLRRPASD